MADDNPFSAYFTAPELEPTPGAEQPQHEAEARTIGTTPETWPPPEPEADDAGEVEPDYPTSYTPPEQDVVADGASAVDDEYTGSWNDWNTEFPAADDVAARRGDEVDWDDWATTTATEQSGDYVPTPTLPRLTDYGGGGKVARRPRRYLRTHCPGARASAARRSLSAPSPATPPPRSERSSDSSMPTSSTAARSKPGPSSPATPRSATRPRRPSASRACPGLRNIDAKCSSSNPIGLSRGQEPRRTAATATGT